MNRSDWLSTFVCLLGVGTVLWAAWLLGCDGRDEPEPPAPEFKPDLPLMLPSLPPGQQERN